MTKSVYLAGKITKNGWRHNIVSGLRDWEHHLLGPAENLDNTWEWPVWPQAIFNIYDYAGPYFIGCDHGCYHGRDSHGYTDNGCSSWGRFEREQVLTLCKNAIQKCDIFFAWVETGDCYGTIAEIGYASALGKQIYIAGPNKIDDMWFVYQMANQINFEHTQPLQALRSLLGLGQIDISNTKDKLLESIAETIKDYREDEISPIIPEHVEIWVNQFSEENQFTILQEMERVLNRYYMSRSHARELLGNLINADTFFGTNPPSILKKTQFLSIQRKGNSQNDLLNLVDGILQDEFSISIDQCGNAAQQYIYLDDGIFSGNTARHDFEEWLSNAGEVEGTTIHFIFFVTHASGLTYFKNKTAIAAQKKGISTKYWSFFQVRDRDNDVESFWPTEITDISVNNYIDNLNQRCQGKSYDPRLFRSIQNPANEVVFSSKESRNIIEHEFLKAGAYIMSLSENNQQSMRPMGYEYFESLGFGSFFVSYRNIPNNCPLALWWGDPTASPAHPLSKWYPLFPRKIND